MRHIENIISTTHIDAHNHKMTLHALESVIHQINNSYIPVGVEHDPRIPPIGRMIGARIEPLEDGEYALVATIELFEEGDKIEYDNERSLPPAQEFKSDSLNIIFDRTFTNDEDQKILLEIGNILNTEPREEFKKALDPITILTLVGVFTLGSILTGFLNAMGNEAFLILKTQIKELLNRKEKEQKERLFIFKSIVKTPNRDVEIEVILSNPNDNEIDQFLDNGIRRIDQIVEACLASEDKLQRVVIEYSDGNFQIKFGVRSDAVPLLPSRNSPRNDDEPS